jgi:oxazoline/thiazoline synthase
VLQGLLELIERDAVALWWYGRVVRRGVHLASLADPFVDALVQHYRGLQRSLWVLDVSSDLGVPCFAALSARTDCDASGGAHDILYGFGCHLDPRVALSRALTEVNQSLEAVPMSGADASAADYRGNPDALRWWQEARTDNQRWLLPSTDEPAADMTTLTDTSTGDLRDDITLLVQRLRERHIEVLVLDQTRPDVGLPVVRVVAPGLRHFWARFGPGRLYDVPVQQGWLARPLTESELNPFVVQF